MPHIDIKLARAYRQTGETGRMHFIAVRPDGSERWLHADRSSSRGLRDLLNEELLSQGYAGTKQDPQAAER